MSEWTIDQIRTFCAKDHQSVAARMTKCMLKHYDALLYEHAQYKQAEFIQNTYDKLTIQPTKGAE